MSSPLWPPPVARCGPSRLAKLNSKRPWFTIRRRARPCGNGAMSRSSVAYARGRASALSRQHWQLFQGCQSRNPRVGSLGRRSESHGERGIWISSDHGIGRFGRIESLAAFLIHLCKPPMRSSMLITMRSILLYLRDFGWPLVLDARKYPP